MMLLREGMTASEVTEAAKLDEELGYVTRGILEGVTSRSKKGHEDPCCVLIPAYTENGIFHLSFTIAEVGANANLLDELVRMKLHTLDVMIEEQKGERGEQA